MRTLNRLAFQVAGVAIVAALTYTIVAPLAAWLAGTI